MSRKLIRSTVVTGGMTLISRITGLARDMAFANLIGAGVGIAADAFYVAFRIPNFFRRIFGEGAFSQAFVPVFTEYKTRGSREDLRAFVDRMAGVLSGILFLFTLAGIAVAPLFVLVMAPGFGGEKFALTVEILRITFPYLLFVSLVALAAGILNSYGRFGAAAFTPVLLNVCLIVAAVWVAPQLERPVLALAWGVFIAGALQLVFQAPFLARLKLLPRPRLAPDHDGVARVLRLMLPAIFGVSVAQINTVVNTILASFLANGSVAWLTYSDRIMEFPLGVFGIALATVILPSLSRKHASNAPEEFSHLLDWALRWVFVIGIPATAALTVLAGPILTTLFHHGAFNDRDVHMTTQALIAFAFGLPGFILIKVLAPGFYARQDTKTPMRVGVLAVLANIVLSLVLVFPLAHVGLALAVSVSAFINAGLLYRGLRRHKVYHPLPGWVGFIIRIMLATAAMTLVLVYGAGDPAAWLAASTWGRIGNLILWVTAGTAVYFVAALALGLRPAQLLLKRREGAYGDE